MSNKYNLFAETGDTFIPLKVEGTHKELKERGLQSESRSSDQEEMMEDLMGAIRYVGSQPKFTKRR